MSFKGVLIIIGIVALGVFITFVVEEIRFRFTNRAPLSKLEVVQGKNQPIGNTGK